MKQLTNTEQIQQFDKVIDYLNSVGHTKKEIALKLDISQSKMSRIISGEIQTISPEIIDNLSVYNINPRYITHGASNMINIADEKYNSFDNFVNKWDLVEHNNKNYLHFTISDNFYNFLLNVYSLKEVSEKTDADSRLADAFEKVLQTRKNRTASELSNLSSYHKEYLNFSNRHKLFNFVEEIFNSMQHESDFTYNNNELKSAFNNALISLEENYHELNNEKEYVLIPVDEMMEITTKNISRKKSLCEVLDIINL